MRSNIMSDYDSFLLLNVDLLSDKSDSNSVDPDA